MSLLYVECKCGCRVKKFKNLINFISLEPAKKNLECPNCGRKYDLKGFYNYLYEIIKFLYEIIFFLSLAFMIVMEGVRFLPIQKVGIQLIIFLLLSFYLSLILITILTKITYLFFPHEEIDMLNKNNKDGK